MKQSSIVARAHIAGIFLLICVTACAPSSPAATATPTPTSGSVAAETPATLATLAVDTPQALPSVKTVDLCAIFSPAQVEPIVGTALITTTPGTDVDEVTGGPLNFCTYKGEDVALVISVAESQSAKDSQTWQDQLAAITNPDEPSTITEENGLGEKAYWVVNEDSAGWYVARYPYVFALVVGGNISLADEYKEDLRRLAEQVLSTLP